MFDAKTIEGMMKMSVSKTFDVHDEHVNVDVSAGLHEVSVMVSINHPSLGGLMNWRMLSQHAVERVECRVFGLSVSECTLDPKLPACRECPLAG